MTHDMKKTLTRLFTVALLMMVSLGARAEVKVLFGEKGTEKYEGKGGTIQVKQEESRDGGKVTVRLAFIPDKNYTFDEQSLEVYKVFSPESAATRALEIDGDALKLEEDKSTNPSEKHYHVDIDSKLALWVKEAQFISESKAGPTRSDYSGTYFIANQNSKGTKYNDSSPATNFYLVPAADPQVQNKRDAFYSSDYTASYGDPEKPFLTTALTNLDDNSAWKITKTNGYYTIQHVVTRKYIVYEPPHSDKPNRKSVHLLATDDPGEMGLFDIQQGSGGYTIRPLSVEGGNRYFNPANTNYNDYHGHEGDYNCNGLVGLYSDGGGNSLWHLESAPTDNSYTFHIIDRQGNIAVKKTVDSQQSLAMLKDYNDIPEDIRSPYLAGETVTFYSFDGDYSSDKLNDENIITATPYANNSNIYVTYTLDHLSEKFLRLRGARAFNIVTNDGCAYDNNGTLAYDSEAANKSQSSHLWNISGGDPYAVKIENLGTHWFLVSSSMPTLSLAENATKFILMEESASATAENEQVKLMKATGTEDLVVEKAEFQANPVSITTKYHLIDKAGKLIQGNIECESSELGLPEEWRSPLVSEYHYFKTSGLSGDTYNPSDPIINPFEVGNGGDIYVTYDVSSDIDLTGGKSYLLKFSDGVSFNQENGSDGINTTQTQAVYPYNNGDFNLYVYGQEQWESQLASGASTRTRWLWKFVSRHGGTDLTGDQVDPYHVVVKSHQNHTIKATKGSDTEYKFPGNSYLQTYKPSDYDGVITNIAYENKEYSQYYSGVMPSTMVNGEPTEYMILGTSLQDMKLKTFSQVAGERRIVNSFEQYWKNNPTIANLSSVPTDWHQFTSWAYSAPVGNDNKRLKEENHWYQTISMGTGEFSVEEVSLTPQVILLDQHGWEVVRVPMYTDNDFTEVNTEALHKFNSPMVSEYHWYPSANKVTGYHKYNISNPAPKIDIYENSANPNNNNKVEWHVVRSESYSSNSLAMTPDDNLDGLDGYAGQDKKYKSDFYVTYTVKPEYANSYTGAATANATVASAVRIKQDGKYASTDGSQITPIEAADNQETIPDEMQWYLRPNFNIDREMGYRYAGESGAYEGAKSQSETETENFANGKNGFDPYNVQIQSKKNTQRYFTANTSASALANGVWTGNSSSLSLQNMTTTSRQTATGYDQTTLLITNATFMVVDDGHGNMRLMPRFDHSTVMQSFTTLAEQNTEADASQTLLLGQAPRLIHSSSEMTSLNGRYILASDFTFANDYVPLGTSEASFSGIIDGQLFTLSGVTKPIIAYANGAVIKNVILDEVSISSGTNVGAICCEATGSTRIYNCGINSGSVGGTGKVGGLVGLLDGTSRVINCYSYANITGGKDKGGIVGYNNVASKQSDVATMVMNCMFYGTIATGENVSPVYGGLNIDNKNSGGLATYNYYLYRTDLKITDNKYNCALAVEEKFLNRFELYRLLLNSNKKLAAIYATGSAANADQMAKWVLETADRSIVDHTPYPYPILKAQGYYPSIINYDVENASDSTSVGRNHGGKLGKTLSVTIKAPNDWSNAPSNAKLLDENGNELSSSRTISLQRTDKDFDRFNFNYDKVQLPYYNDVGTKNYTGNRVVTGWKITNISGGTAGDYHAGDEWGGYNFADRNCTNKDKFDVSGRVFSQGAYFDVPYGVTAITIEPYWGVAAYVSDQYYDVVYKENGDSNYSGQNVNEASAGLGTQATNEADITINGSTQKVYTSIDNARKSMSIPTSTTSGKTVYDYAVVLIGNVHQAGPLSGDYTPYTITSVDLDKDNEPDYSFIFSHHNRQAVSPIRFDFLNVVGTAQAQKPNGTSRMLNVSIFKPKGWFEVTNTCSIYFVQFEGDNGNKTSAPIILLGGAFDQFTSTQSQKVTTSQQYIHLGSNCWFKAFGNGTHGDGFSFTSHVPVSVTGGDFDGFYLSGVYRPDAGIQQDNAECYISSGRFNEVAGAAQQMIDGDVHWQIYDADITNFYGGGINAAKPITGDITVDIFNSHVDTYCGGPKFGDMQKSGTTFTTKYSTNKAGSSTANYSRAIIKDGKVTTNATGCQFNKFFGAGYGGTSYSELKFADATSYNFTNLANNYINDRGKYFTGTNTAYKSDYGNKGPGVATDFSYEFFIWSTGQVGARFYVKYASFSLAQCNDVESKLKKCVIENNFYGGGSIGKVAGTVTSELDGCKVKGNVFGAGYSASLPTTTVRSAGFTSIPKFNSQSGMFEPGAFSDNTDFNWTSGTLTENATAINESGENQHDIYTNINLSKSNLGSVDGNVTLTIKGNSKIGTDGDTTKGNVYGGGESSYVTGADHTVTVNLQGNAEVLGNVFGGGDSGVVEGSTVVNIEQ